MKIQYLLFVQQMMKDGPENSVFSSTKGWWDLSEKGRCFMQLLIIGPGNDRLGKMISSVSSGSGKTGFIWHLQ